MEKVRLTHGKAPGSRCELHPCGATLTSWRVDGEDLIFVSSKAKLDGSKAIRGGIPICFPAFGPWEFGPQHGFARSSNEWKIAQAAEVDPETGDSKVVLELRDSEQTRKTWDKPFVLRYAVTLKKAALQLTAEIKNTGTEALEVNFCFHTYIKVPDVDRCQVDSFLGVPFIDKTEEGNPLKVEERRSVTVHGFTDRVYKGAPNACVLSGLNGGKKLKFEKTANFSDFVIWNPWTPNKLADMGDEDYKSMICVEAAACTVPINIPPGETWKGEHTIQVADDSSPKL